MISKTFEELGQYRDENGYIDMDAVMTSDDKAVREVRGNTDREKDWIEINGGSIMIKTDTEGLSNAEYSEMISCALARQAGIKTAEYDMAKYKGGKGLITKNICAPGEEMVSLQELIGSGPDNEEYPDSIDINHVFDALPEKLKSEGIDEEQIDGIMLGIRKQMLFDLCVMEADRHTENISLIKYVQDGKVCMRLAPMYDTEAALVLFEEDPERMKKTYSSYLATGQTVEVQEPRITCIPESANLEEEDRPKGLNDLLAILAGGVKTPTESEYGSPSEEMWKTTFDFLCDDERALDYYENVLSKLSIGQAIREVEGKIGTKMPDHIVNMATACFNMRRSSMCHYMMVEEPVINDDVKRDGDIIE